MPPPGNPAPTETPQATATPPLSNTPPLTKKPAGGKWATWAVLALVVVAVGALSFYLPSYINEQTTPTPTPRPNVDPIISKGKIVIGTDATYPPMEATDANGALVGYDIDLGRKIAENLSVTAEFKDITWDDLFPALVNKEVDVIISAVTINDERELIYDFTDPYLNAGQVIITQKTNTTISTTADLQGLKIAVQSGTTNEAEALKYTGVDMVVAFENFEDATAALVAGEADAIFSDLTNAKGIIESNPELKIASAPFTNDYYGVVVRQGESDLVGAINEILDSLRQQGFLVFLQQKWLE